MLSSEEVQFCTQDCATKGSSVPAYYIPERTEILCKGLATAFLTVTSASSTAASAQLFWHPSESTATMLPHLPSFRHSAAWGFTAESFSDSVPEDPPCLKESCKKANFPPRPHWHQLRFTVSFTVSKQPPPLCHPSPTPSPLGAQPNCLQAATISSPLFSKDLTQLLRHRTISPHHRERKQNSASYCIVNKQQTNSPGQPQ